MIKVGLTSSDDPSEVRTLFPRQNEMLFTERPLHSNNGQTQNAEH
jgi:hypothetical protein